MVSKLAPAIFCGLLQPLLKLKFRRSKFQALELLANFGWFLISRSLLLQRLRFGTTSGSLPQFPLDSEQELQRQCGNAIRCTFTLGSCIKRKKSIQGRRLVFLTNKGPTELRCHHVEDLTVCTKNLGGLRAGAASCNKDPINLSSQIQQQAVSTIWKARSIKLCAGCCFRLVQKSGDPTFLYFKSRLFLDEWKFLQRLRRVSVYGIRLRHWGGRYKTQSEAFSPASWRLIGLHCVN